MVHPLHKSPDLMLFTVEVVVLAQAHLVGQLFVRYGVLHGVLKGQYSERYIFSYLILSGN
jgi:hypothetical protein